MSLKRVYQTVMATALIYVLASATGLAQTEQPKVAWEVQYSALRLSDFDVWLQGVGTRGGYHFNRHVALEGEVNFFFSRGAIFPRAGLALPAATYVGKHATQGLFGVKAGIGGNRFGVFGKLRPGLIHFNQSICPGGTVLEGKCFGQLIPGTCRAANGQIIPCPQTLNGQTRFALNFGGVLEFHPTRRLVIRLDVGDTLIRHSQPGRTSHNLQLGTGVGWRF